MSRHNDTKHSTGADSADSADTANTMGMAGAADTTHAAGATHTSGTSIDSAANTAAARTGASTDASSTGQNHQAGEDDDTQQTTHTASETSPDNQSSQINNGTSAASSSRRHTGKTDGEADATAGQIADDDSTGSPDSDAGTSHKLKVTVVYDDEDEDTNTGIGDATGTADGVHVSAGTDTAETTDTAAGASGSKATTASSTALPADSASTKGGITSSTAWSSSASAEDADDAPSAVNSATSAGTEPAKGAGNAQDGEKPESASGHSDSSAAASSHPGESASPKKSADKAAGNGATTLAGIETSNNAADGDSYDEDVYDEDLDSLPEEADILLKSYPAFSFNHVTFTDGKTGRNLIDNAQWSFESGSLYAVTGADDAQRRAFLAAAGGFSHPDSGQVMVRSASLATLEINDIRGHRIGLVTQRHSVRGNLDAIENLEYAMRASGRTFLRPISEIANSLLNVVGFDQAATGVPVNAMSEVNRRRLAIARSISCDAGVIVVDAPIEGLSAEDAGSIATLLRHLAHAKNPKRCVIALTDASPLTSVADEIVKFND